MDKCLCLLRSEDPVSRVTETGKDVAVFVKLAVKDGREDADIRMCSGNPLHPFRCGEKADEPDSPRPLVFEE